MENTFQTFRDTYTRVAELPQYQNGRRTYICSGRVDARKVLLQVHASNDASSIAAEKTILSHLTHPSIPTVVEFSPVDDSFAVVKNFFSSTTLGMISNSVRPHTVDQYKTIIRNILDAINYLHSKGYVYSRINPDTILVDDNLNIQLFDFSDARPITQPVPKSLYMLPPPELLRGELVDPSFADVWSIGVLLFLCASHAMPWEAEDETQLAEEYRFTELNRPLAIRNDFFNYLEQMLEVDVGRRFSLAQATQHAFLESMTSMKPRKNLRRFSVEPITGSYTRPPPKSLGGHASSFRESGRIICLQGTGIRHNRSSILGQKSSLQRNSTFI